MVLQHIVQPESHSRATENYPQFCRALQVIRLQEGTMGRCHHQDRDRDIDRAACERPTNLLKMRPTGAGLRPSGRASVRVCPAVADRGVLRLCHAARRLSDVWRVRRTRSLVRWQESIDDDLPLVLGGLGQATFLEGRGRRVRHDVAERVLLGKTRGFLGFGVSEPLRHRVDWRGRSTVAKGAQVPDAGLSNRQRLEAAAMDWEGSNRENLPAVLPDVGQRTFKRSEVRLQRYVETLPEGDRQEGGRSDSRARPISHYAEDEQGNRRGPSGRGEANEGGRLRAGAQTFTLVPAQTAGEPDRQTDRQVGGIIEIQSAVGAGTLATRRFSAILGVRGTRLGRQVPRSVVYSYHAISTRSNEEGRTHLAQSPGADPQLVSSKRRTFIRNRRGIQQQSKTDHEKIVRLSDLRSR